MPDTPEVHARLRAIVEALPDPELGLTLGELGMVDEITVTGQQITVRIALTTPGCPLKSQIKSSLANAIDGSELSGRALRVEFSELSSSQKERAMQLARRGVQLRAQTPPSLVGTQLLAFSSGKGGVGKSSIAAAVAHVIASRGHHVGLLDADIWGFSQAQLLATGEERLEAEGNVESFRIKPHRTPIGSGSLGVVSMGMMVTEAGSAIMWRGLMLSRALQHFIEDVDWGNPDFLLIDLPPGTGDIPMTLARLLPSTTVAIVTTPSSLASHVAERAGSFALKANLSLLGVIENMSSIECPHGDRLTPFGSGGGDHIAKAYDIPLLANLPLTTSLEHQPELIELSSRILEELGRRDEGLLRCSARLWDAVAAP